jgi:hypothetical protein
MKSLITISYLVTGNSFLNRLGLPVIARHEATIYNKFKRKSPKKRLLRASQ